MLTTIISLAILGGMGKIAWDINGGFEGAKEATKEAINSKVDGFKEEAMDIACQSRFKKDYIESKFDLLEDLESCLQHKGYEGDEFTEVEIRRISGALAVGLEREFFYNEIEFLEELSDRGYNVDMYR